jgi:hypothetical protein
MNRFSEHAIAADALVTYNVADFAAAGEQFRIAILGPGELLRKVKP